MATSTLSALVRIPGRVCTGPTALTGSYPFVGGTDLGSLDDFELVVDKYLEKVTEEGFGTQVTFDKLVVGEDWTMRMKLRGPAGGSIHRFFSGGSSSGVLYPGSTSPGTWLGDRSVGILFVPYDPAKWALYFKRGLLSVTSRPIQHASGRDVEVEVIAEAGPVDSGEKAQWRPLASIVVS